MILLAFIKPSKPPKPVTINRFLGLNTANELQLVPGESPDMCNFRISSDYRLEKREGLSMFDIDYSSALSSDELHDTYWGGLWYGKLGSDTKNYIYRFIDIEDSASGNHFSHIIKIDLDIKKAVAKISVGTHYIGIAEMQYIFYKNNFIYILTGDGYYKFDGTTASSVGGTTPTLYINVKPDLSDRINKVYQPINLLTGWRNVSYYADNTSVYTMPETPYSSATVKVYVNEAEKTEYTHYNVSGNTVTFTSGNIPSTGADVVIKYIVQNLESRFYINKCRYGIFFGGNQDADLFVWGNPDDKNKLYYTYGGDVEFFAATNYLNIGTSESGITGAAIQNNTLALFTDQGIYSLKTAININSQSLVTTVTYPLTYVKDDRGHAYPNCDIKVVNNNPFFISNDNSIWQLVVSTFRDDRAAKYVSERVQGLLNNADLTNAFTIDWETKGEYWLYYEVPRENELFAKDYFFLIYNYRNNTWYRYEVPMIVNGYVLVDDKLMLYEYKDFFIFDEKNMSDFGIPINAYWESPYMDYGAPYFKKSVRSMYITLAAHEDKDSFVRMEYFTSDNETPETIDFSLLKGEPPKPLYTEISAVGFKYIKYKFISDKLDSNSQIIGFTTTATYGGYVR